MRVESLQRMRQWEREREKEKRSTSLSSLFLSLHMQCDIRKRWARTQHDSASSFIENNKSAPHTHTQRLRCWCIVPQQKFFVFKILRWRVQTIYLDLKYPKKCEQTETMGWANERMCSTPRKILKSKKKRKTDT